MKENIRFSVLTLAIIILLGVFVSCGEIKIPDFVDDLMKSDSSKNSGIKTESEADEPSGESQSEPEESFGEPSYESQSEPSYESQSEPSYESQSDPSYESQSDPSYESVSSYPYDPFPYDPLR